MRHLKKGSYEKKSRYRSTIGHPSWNTWKSCKRIALLFGVYRTKNADFKWRYNRYLAIQKKLFPIRAFACYQKNH